MRFVFLMIIAYLVFRAVGKLLTTFKIETTEDDPKVSAQNEAERRFEIDNDTIEDAEFKDVD